MEIQKKILLGITGSIAAYKSVEIIRLFKERGVDVRVVMTEAAASFTTALTLQAISNNPVYQFLLNAETEAAMSHIDLARWADAVIIAPATAHFLAKLAHGFADDLLTTLCLATTSPLFIAPAMNKVMWENQATQDNYSLLQKRNIRFIGPDQGVQACGDVGWGRMCEPQQIVTVVDKFLLSNKRFSGKRILITAGPTQESIDPVRYISNHSSGKMGYALATASLEEGAVVTLITGPTSLTIPNGVKPIHVVTADEMLQAVMNELEGEPYDFFIGVAAVADYRPLEKSNLKIKKDAANLRINLVRNPDILEEVTKLKNPPYVIGFAAETDNVIANAKQKLKTKQLDMIVANKVGNHEGFLSDENELSVITENEVIELPRGTKSDLARKLMQLIDTCIQTRSQHLAI